MSRKKIRVAELFAGVGGFRLGLERYSGSIFSTVWNNQWEPSTKRQHASEVYINRFGSAGHSNIDIAKVTVSEIPEHDLLVGGFPCQDYSVAKNLGSSVGITGKKGVLWWEIYRILKDKGRKRPSYLMLENVDRLIKSPAKHRGRDFAIIVASLNNLGYAVEWRIINAAEYGMPQRRRRIFIMAYKNSTDIYQRIIKNKSVENWVAQTGVIASAFPLDEVKDQQEFEIEGDLHQVSDNFNNRATNSPFGNTGLSINRKVFTCNTKPKYDGPVKNLGDVLLEEKDIPKEFFIKKEDISKWKYLKGAKKEKRKSKNGFDFMYTEGAMVFPDSLERPSRTIITAEGGLTPSRFKHVVRTKSGKLRRLTPIELERLCMFPDNHTEGQSDTKRAFFMGNALVVGVVERLAKSLAKHM